MELLSPAYSAVRKDQADVLMELLCLEQINVLKEMGHVKIRLLFQFDFNDNSIR